MKQNGTIMKASYDILDPDDEISKGVQSTVEWMLDREMSDVELPNFWLIMTITKDYVTVYFHCR